MHPPVGMGILSKHVQSRLRRKQPKRLLCLTNSNSPFVIEIEGHDRGPTNGSQSNDLIIVPDEMVWPTLQARIEKLSSNPTVRVDCLDSIRLAKITTATRPRQIVQVGPTATRAGNNVLQMKSGALQALMHAAVLATIIRPTGD
jgi:hypothetical protein